MNLDAVRRVADAVLYEGYILYPYRASAQKNRSRWQFGVLMPPAYAAVDPSETTRLRADCVIENASAPEVSVITRFLQVQRRTRLGAARDPAIPASWDEAVEHEMVVTLSGADRVAYFEIPGGEEHEADIVRRRAPLIGAVSVHAEPLPGPWQATRLTVEVANVSVAGCQPVNREDGLPAALVAAHLIISVDGGAFLSMTDPPEWAKPAVDACRARTLEHGGCWPVLASPDRRVMLVSPIILPDYPQVAPESAGELYDGTEIDEILTLRTLALSDEEKREARATDPRAAALLDRVESMDGAALGKLHGTFRTPDVPWWDPEADASVSPDTDSVTVAGQQLARGSRVTLRPGVRRADAQDMFLAGRPAIVEAVLLDVDDNPYLAVSLSDGPDVAHGRFLYFSPDEVEP